MLNRYHVPFFSLPFRIDRPAQPIERAMLSFLCSLLALCSFFLIPHVAGASPMCAVYKISPPDPNKPYDFPLFSQETGLYLSDNSTPSCLNAYYSNTPNPTTPAAPPVTVEAALEKAEAEEVRLGLKGIDNGIIWNDYVYFVKNNDPATKEANPFIPWHTGGNLPAGVGGTPDTTYHIKVKVTSDK